MPDYNVDLNVEIIPVGEITPYENNARKHADEDVGAIVESIKEFGFDDPIGVWGDKNIIVEGHGRLLAAKRLGMTEVPCIRLDHLSDEQRRAYALAHNRTAELSAWDFELRDIEIESLDIDMSRFGFDEIEQTEKDTAEAEEDDYEETPPEDANTKPGEVYRLGRHRLICGDSTRGETFTAVMDGVKADISFTSPPYNADHMDVNLSAARGGGGTERHSEEISRRQRQEIG